MWYSQGVFNEHFAPRFPNSIVPEEALLPVTVLIWVCILLNVSLYLSTPGRLIKKKLGEKYLEDAHARFAYDGIMYKRGNSWCDKTEIMKPARAKFSHMTGYCCEKFDHYNVLVSNDIGLMNMKQYLLFLTMNTLLFTYVAVIGLLTIIQLPDEMDLWNQRFWTQKGEVYLEGNPWAIYGYASI